MSFWMFKYYFRNYIQFSMEKFSQQLFWGLVVKPNKVRATLQRYSLRTILKYRTVFFTLYRGTSTWMIIDTCMPLYLEIATKFLIFSKQCRINIPARTIKSLFIIEA